MPHGELAPAYFFDDPVAAAEGISEVAPKESDASVFTSSNVVVVVRSKIAKLGERIRRVLTEPKVTGAPSP